jgi:hypothetical protein
MMQCADFSTPHKLIGVARREVQNLGDFGHCKETFWMGGLILFRLLIDARQSRSGQSAKYGRATSDQDAPRRFRETSRVFGRARDLVEARDCAQQVGSFAHRYAAACCEKSV